MKEINIKKLFNEPKIIAVAGNPNSGKSNVLHHLILETKKSNNFKMYSYGLKFDFGQNVINSVPELEQIDRSIIFLDEFYTLFDLENRKERASIERTFRSLFHSNNIIILCGLPDNFKKFISAKLDLIIFKECNLDDFINGSKLKAVCLDYKGDERGSYLLKLNEEEALFYNVKDSHWEKAKIPYYKEYDLKRQNPPLLMPKNVPKNVLENAQKNYSGKKSGKNMRKMFQKNVQENVGENVQTDIDLLTCSEKDNNDNLKNKTKAGI